MRKKIKLKHSVFEEKKIEKNVGTDKK